MQRHPGAAVPVFLLLLFVLTACLPATRARAQSASDPVTRIDPPHWWVGLGEGQLQLLVYGPGIAAWTPSVQHEGLVLERVQRTTNPDYLFLDLSLQPGLEPGTVSLVFSKDKRHVVRPFDLKARSGRQPAGLGPEDLMYLIMPDRFANGNPANDVIPGMNDQSLDRSNDYLRHGGDLAGITARLDYLQDLGVTAIWLNPVLENDQPEASYHGYAATDLYRIDPRLGTHQDFLDFAEACRQRGIKVVQDVVHNHWGDRHPLFTNPVSPSWVHHWPEFTRTTYKDVTLMDPYAAEADRLLMTDGWFDSHMPDLNQRDPLLARYLLQNNLWWIEEGGIDALRMDTWAYSDRGFLEDWSRAVRTAYPSLGLFAETWVHGSSVQAYYTGHTIMDKNFQPDMPGLTDFQLYYAIGEALNKPMGWTEGVNRLYLTLAKDFIYKDPSRNVVFLDNHDLSRFFGTVGRDMNKFKAGINWLMTVRGIPMLYYGTEILMGEIADEHGGSVRKDFPGGWPGDSLNKFWPKAEPKPSRRRMNTCAAWRAGGGTIRCCTGAAPPSLCPNKAFTSISATWTSKASWWS
jgi:neopullulanase